MEEKRKRGRPKGTTQFPGERKKNGTWRVTPTLEPWITANLPLLEEMCRRPHQVQWKMF